MVNRNQHMPPLPRQIRDILAERIESGLYRPGQKLNGVRKLSKEFEVSAVTAGEALRLLEKDSYVVCVPGSGTYVMSDIGTIGPPLKIVLAFPEEAISRDILSHENWAISSEAYRGLVAGAKANNASIYFEHFRECGDECHRHRQLKQLQQYDAAVFMGTQLSALQEELAKTMPVYQLPAIYCTPPPGIREINYDWDSSLRTLLEYLARCGYREVGALSFHHGSNELLLLRADRFRSLAGNYGMTAPDEYDWRFPASGDVKQFLEKKFNSGIPEFILCNNSEMIVEVYQACHDRGIRIGHDLGLGGIASGLTFAGLIPSFTHIRVPVFEITQALVGAVRRRETPPILKITEDFLIKGHSTTERNES